MLVLRAPLLWFGLSQLCELCFAAASDDKEVQLALPLGAIRARTNK